MPLTYQERKARRLRLIEEAKKSGLSGQMENLSLKVTGIIKNSNSPAEASGKISDEVKKLLKQRINLVLADSPDLNTIKRRLLELKSEL